MPPFKFPLADRLLPLQTNVFADMDRAKTRAKAAGRDLIDLSLGSSDLPAPEPVLAAIAEALSDPSTHGYLLHGDTLAFRQAAAAWYERKFGLGVDPDSEVLLLIGSQEGTAHLPLALLNPGDVALLPDPCYPSHPGGIHLANGQIHFMPLRAEHQFLPRFDEIPAAVLERSKLMVLSYPNNPTTAVAPLSFFEEAVAFCQQHGIALAHDFPYPDWGFDGIPIPSVLQADRDKTIAIEFFSLSKSYNMGGFRVGYGIGNAALIAGLRQVKAVVDFNQYGGILRGAIAALSGPQAIVLETNQRFQRRRDGFIAALHRIGWTVPTPPATMYVWAKLPEPWGDRSRDFCQALVEATGVALSPGVGFGPSGEGYVRFALVHDLPRLEEAATRIATFLERPF
ncbi:MAG: LL-diaminopimelate aminotransferase [Synechococcales cyanobacterium RM1_1_8]|nr:LL-diaminopimelate aminotransferase [Synechococcales cyanobacterium RM1_1_8]